MRNEFVKPILKRQIHPGEMCYVTGTSVVQIGHALMYSLVCIRSSGNGVSTQAGSSVLVTTTKGRGIE